MYVIYNVYQCADFKSSYYTYCIVKATSDIIIQFSDCQTIDESSVTGVSQNIIYRRIVQQRIFD